MNRGSRVPVYALAAALLASCAAPRPAQRGDASGVSDVIGYANRVATMNAAEQRRELNAAQAAYRRDSSNASRLRLGLLYALPATALQDDARAIALLEGDDSTPRDGALAQLGQLVATQVRERQRQVREEQRKGDTLRQQLEALKAIERSLIERRERAGTDRP